MCATPTPQDTSAFRLSDLPGEPFDIISGKTVAQLRQDSEELQRLRQANGNATLPTGNAKRPADMDDYELAEALREARTPENRMLLTEASNRIKYLSGSIALADKRRVDG